MLSSPPETRYARNGDVRIAYQVVGQGSIDLLFVPGFISNLEVQWEDPGYSHLLRRLSKFCRLIQFDKRGTGLSDRVDPAHLPNLEMRMEDVHAVLDAAGSGRAALLGASEGAPMAILFAATYPERTRALVLYGGYAHFHKWVLSPEALARFFVEAETSWGTGATLRHFAPGRVNDPHFSAWWARFERLSASPTAAIALARMNAAIDVRGVLADIRAPTLVVHRSEDARVNPEAGRYLARHIKGARLIEIPGRDHPIWTGDVDRAVDAIEEFLTGARPHPQTSRVLVTLHIARIVGPERHNVTLGDRQWLECVDRFKDTAAETARRHGGQILRWDADKMLARFDGPARAASCAIALREAGNGLGLRLAQALHVGEVEMDGDSVAGIALSVAERIASHAQAGDMLASALVAELAAGSGLRFVERDAIAFDGFEQPVRLVAIVTEQHLEPKARKTGDPDLGKLSQREGEVLMLVAEGLSNAAIAAALHRSEHTVKRHVANILLKLDLPTRAAAAALAGRKKP
jgi:pimeloyl-ACP methyl ester carboxylesterase/DNA-binding CsgD family transcriptional regulator